MTKPNRFLTFNGFRLDVGQDVVFNPLNIPIKLTEGQVRVLKILAENSAENGKPWLKYAEIAARAGVKENSVGNHIEKLRNAMGADEFILNHKKFGYRLGPQASWCEDDISNQAANRQAETVGGQPGKLNDDHWAEKTYFAYRDAAVPLMGSTQLIEYLEKRYGCEAIRIDGKAFAATALWKNEDQLIRPDTILGELDITKPTPLKQSAVLTPDEYTDARSFIERKYTDGPIKHEGRDYRMTSIDLKGKVPRMEGAYGLYYDNILTQYAMEWELKKAVLKGGPNALAELDEPGKLPLRDAAERHGNPLLLGNGRCAAITTSTLVVFQRRKPQGFHCLLRKRSSRVGVSPGMLHVVPAGMFEARNYGPWSAEMNVWREMLEEVYNQQEQHGGDVLEDEDYILRKLPISLLIRMIEHGLAEFSVTGICCDLLTLRPEICTILFVKDPSFYEAKRIEFNWEYESRSWDSIEAGKGAILLKDVDEVITAASNSYGVVVSAAACLSFGLDWLRQRHKV